MKQRRPFIVPRRPIFLGCEGESEQGYGQVLNDLLRAAELPIHLEVVTLNPGVGDPITRIHRAEQEINRREQRRSKFYQKAILMDGDQAEDGGSIRREAELLARNLGISIIWQDPCHEAFLLRHLDGCLHRRPPTTAVSLAALRGVWPQYNKPMTKMNLAKRIGMIEILRAAKVEPSLATFLRALRLLT